MKKKKEEAAIKLHEANAKRRAKAQERNLPAEVAKSSGDSAIESETSRGGDGGDVGRGISDAQCDGGASVAPGGGEGPPVFGVSTRADGARGGDSSGETNAASVSLGTSPDPESDGAAGLHLSLPRASAVGRLNCPDHHDDAPTPSADVVVAAAVRVFPAQSSSAAGISPEQEPSRSPDSSEKLIVSPGMAEMGLDMGDLSVPPAATAGDAIGRLADVVLRDRGSGGGNVGDNSSPVLGSEGLSRRGLHAESGIVGDGGDAGVEEGLARNEEGSVDGVVGESAMDVVLTQEQEEADAICLMYDD